MAVNSYKQDEHSTDVGKMKTLMRLFSYLLDYKKEILAVLAIMAFCVFVSLVNPLIMENAIDKHISTGDFPGAVVNVTTPVVRFTERPLPSETVLQETPSLSSTLALTAAPLNPAKLS